MASEMRAFFGGRPAPLDTLTGGVVGVAGVIVVGGGCWTTGDSPLTEAFGSSSVFTLEMLGLRLRWASEGRRPRRRSEFIFSQSENNVEQF